MGSFKYTLMLDIAFVSNIDGRYTSFITGRKILDNSENICLCYYTFHCWLLLQVYLVLNGTSLSSDLKSKILFEGVSIISETGTAVVVVRCSGR
jgi:hypothetical protein